MPPAVTGSMKPAASTRRTAPGAWCVQSQAAPHRRVRAVGADDQAGAPDLPAHAQADRAPVLDDRAVDGDALECLDAAGGARRLEQRAVEMEAPLSQRHRRCA